MARIPTTRIASFGRVLAAAAIATLVPAHPACAGPPCPGDVDGDGVVAVSDLVSVIVAWGPYAPCPPQVPEDVNGDCVVDVQDLVGVLTSWGPCGSAATGACCVDRGCVETTPVECAGLDGTYLGDETTCPGGACGAGVVGACCRPNGTCIEVDIPACRAQGGVHQGPGVECSPDPCG
ncbi:MAG: hypothetical protein ACYTGR_09960 [Planctomycetota bacterium]